MANEDVVWVDVLPSLENFTSSLKRGLAAATGTSRTAGSEAGRAFGSGFNSSADAAIAAASSKVATAKLRAENATGALSVAQARLNELTAKGVTTGGQYAAAVERVEKAKRSEQYTTENLRAATTQLDVVKRAAKSSEDGHTAAIVANNKETEKAPGLIEKFSSGWIKTAAVLGTVTYAAYGIKQAFGALYSTIDVASGLNEEINKSQVVFGDAAKSVIDFTNNAARGMGQSRLEALQATGIFGNLFRAVGLTTDQSAQMSTQLVQLAADLASFNNADPSEVLLAMRAGLVGESEPMRRFGVDLSDLALRQEAANLKIYDGTGVLNQSQKAQAAYSLLLKQTTLAQGDFVRTSAGLANSTRILKGEWTDLKGAIGGLLLGPATGVVHWLNDLLPSLSANIEGLHKFGQAFAQGFSGATGAANGGGLVAVFQSLGDAVRSTVDWFRSLADMITGAFRSGLQTAGPLLAGVDGSFTNLVGTLSAVSSHWHELITTVVEAFLPVIRTLVPLVAQIASAFAQVLGSALQAIIPILSVVADAAGQVATVLADALLGVIRQIQPILPGLASAFSEVANTLGRGLLAVVKELTPVLSTWAQALGEVAQILAGAFLSVIKALEPVLPVLAQAFVDIATTVAGALAQALNDLAPVLPVLARAFGDIALAVGGALAQAVGAIAPVLPPLVEAFVKLLQAAVQPLLPLLPTLARILGDIVGAITPLVPAAAEIVAAFAHMATGVLPALNPVLSTIANVVGVLARAFEALPGPVQLVLGAFILLKSTLGVNIFTKVVEGVGGLATSFATTMPRITGVVSGMTTAVKGELASLSGAFAAAKLAQQELVASNFGIGKDAVPKAVGDLAGLEAAAGRVATGGFGLIKSAGSSLLSFFGGPWGLAIAGVGIGLSALIGFLSQESEATKRSKAATEEWTQALASANGIIDASTRKAAALALEHAGVLDIAQRLKIPLGDVVDAVTGEGDAFENVKQRLQNYIDQHSTAEGRSAQFGKSLDDEGQAAQDALTALEGLNTGTGNTITAQGRVKTATDEAAQSQRNQTQALKDYIDQQLGATDAALGYQAGVLNVRSAIEQYNQGLQDGTLSGTARAQAENSIAQSILATTEAAGRAAAQQLGPNADANAKTIASASAEKAAFEQLVAQLGFIPPSLQGVADTLGVTDASLQASRESGVDPTAQAWGNFALSTIQGTFLPIFGSIPAGMQPTLDAIASQPGVLAANATAWHDFATGVQSDVAATFGFGGGGQAVPDVIDHANIALNNQGAAGGPLQANLEAWRTWASGVAQSLLVLGGGNSTGGGPGSGSVPDVIDHANIALNGQAAPGGPLANNGQAWHDYLGGILGDAFNTFGAPNTGVPQSLNNTNSFLYGQAAPGGPLALNKQAWHDYVAGVTGDILGLFGFKGGAGALPGAVTNGEVQLDAFRSNATNNLGTVGAAFTTMASIATDRMGAVEGHINGPMTTALASFSTQAVNHTNVVDAAFTTMQTTTSARMADVENHIYGPMTSALVTLSNNSGTYTGQVVNAFNSMATGSINASNTAATGINAAWDRIKAGVAGPVNFVISAAIAGALIPAFNNVAAAVGIAGIGVGLPTVKLAEGGPVPGYADGGPIGGAYIGPRADNVPGYIALSGGGAAPVRLNPREFVQPVASVDQYGLGFMEAVRTGAFPTAIARAFAEGGRIPGFAGGGQTYPTLEAWVRANLPGAVITSAYRPGANDYHGAGDAVDISYPGNPQSRNMPAAAKIAASFGGITELIHNPNASIKNGRIVAPAFWGASTWAQHANHVHWAMTPSALAGGGTPVGLPAGITVNGQLVTSSAQVASMLDSAIAGPLGQLSARYGSTQLTRYLGDFTHSLTNRVFGAIRGRVDSAIAAAAAAAAAATASAGTVASGPVKTQVASVFGTRGWGSGAQWSATDNIVSRESGWNPNAQNPTSTASGLFQHIDATWRAYRRPSAAGYAKMRLAPVPEQAWAGLNYIAGRYGSPSSAWGFWQGHHYYDDGGLLYDGMTGSNTSGEVERVLSPRQTVAFERLVDVLDRGNAAAVGGGPTHVTGTLVLDSGEFIGHVQGVLVTELDRRDGIDARMVRSA